MAETILKGKRYTVDDILREETMPYELHDKIKSFVKKNPKTICDLENIVFKSIREEASLEEQKIKTEKKRHVGVVDILLSDYYGNVYIIEIKNNLYYLDGQKKKIRESHIAQVTKYYNFYNKRKIKCSVYLVGIEDGVLVSEKINFNESHSASG